MTLSNLIKRAMARGVFLYSENNELKFKLSTEGFPADLKAEILQHKVELIDFLTLGTKVSSVVEQTPISKHAETCYPIKTSFAQQRLWFIDQLQQGSVQYNMTKVFNIDGALNIDIAEQAISKIINRHEILRTIYRQIDDQTVQIVNTEFDFSLVRHDLTHLDPLQQVSKVNELINKDKQKSFDLTQDIMVRVTYLQLNSHSKIGTNTPNMVLFNMHHIASDGWSIGILLKEFIAIYQSIIQGDIVAFEPMDIQYADYALWQRQCLTKDVLQQQLDYWSEQLQNIPTVHSLPLSARRSLENAHTGATIVRQLKLITADHVKKFADMQHITPFMLFHGILALLISRHSNQKDIVIGTAVAGRTQQQLKSLIGLFVNTLVLRLNTEPQTLKEYLTQVKRVNLDAQQHQSVPFEQLVEQTKISRSTLHTPLFQIMLTLDNFGQTELQLPGVNFTEINEPQVISKFDLSLNIQFNQQGLSLNWTYNSSIFSKSYLESFAEHFELLLQSTLSQINNDMDQEISVLSMLSAKDQHKLIHQLHGKDIDRTQQPLIHRRVEHQAIKNSQNIAVIYDEQRLTYKVLNQYANKLANYLVEHHLNSYDKNPVVIGVNATRSIELLTNLLAIMKLGATYVMLDPALPKERIDYIIKDADIKLILDYQPAVNCWTTSIPVVNIDKHQLINYNDKNPNFALNANKLMYILYTSGSTGQPKGVALSHDSVLDYCLYAESNYYSNCQGSLLVTSPVFDISIPSLFIPLMTGDSVELLNDDNPLCALATKLAVPDTPPKLLRMTPLHVQGLLELLPEKYTTNTAHVFVVGGEKFPPATAKQLQQVFTGSQIYNHYGPTEASVGCCIFDVSALGDQLNMFEQLPIGKPMENTQLYVLNSERQLAPFGAIGELYIGGSGLAQGYINNQELTTSTFIDHPFSLNTQKKLYKSGDLVRYISNDNLEFVGRVDHQIKIRGFRIELSEIENQLNQCKNIAVSCVVADQDRLVAYVAINKVTTQAKKPTQKQLNDVLRTKLPDYMIPTVIMVLEQMPLTANGKVDRKMLPSADFIQSPLTYQGAKTTTELSLLTIWEKLLKQSKDVISVTCDFFALGGHSLLVIRMISDVRKILAHELTIKTIFATPTIRALALLIDNSKGNSPLRTVIVPLKSQLNEPSICAFAQQRLWFIDQLQKSSSEYHMPAVLSIEGDFNLSIAEEAIIQIIHRHPTLRSVFSSEGDNIMQTVLHEYQFTLQQHDLSHLNKAEQEIELKKLIKDHQDNPFDLACDLMIRVAYVHLCDVSNQHQGFILFNMHHIASDGWSRQVFFKEFSLLYRAILKGEPASLPALTIQYRDFSAWQRQWLTASVLELQLNYWRKQLCDAPMVHNLPLDYIRPQNKRHHGAIINSCIDNQLTQRLLKISHQAQLTPFMLLHGALSLVLSHHSNSNDIIIGTPVANRMQAELEPLIGFFVNSLVLRTNTCFDHLHDYFVHIKMVNLDAQSHQDIPFEQLVEYCQVPRSSQHTPLFQIVLSINNNEQHQLSLPNAKLTTVSQDLSAKFDLQISVKINDNGMEFDWLYDTSIFNQTHITTLSDHLNRLLLNIAEQPNAKLSDLTMLSGDECDYLLHQLNQTKANYPEDKLIHQLFEQQVMKYPNVTAVVFNQQQLSYKALNQQANQLAYHLKTQGVETGSIVGLYIERSLDMFVGILAILKTGAAYVPIDVNSPQARIKYIIKDTGLTFLLTHKKVIDVFDQYTNLSVLALDDKKNQTHISRLPDDNLLCTQHNPLAYIIYTSGSTGTPKGVLIHHKNIVSFASDNQYLDLKRTNGVLALSSIAFDGSIFDIFVPLIHGKTTVILGPDDITSTAKWNQCLDQHQIDSVFMTTALFNQLCIDDLKLLQRFEQILFGGEQADIKSISTFLQSNSSTTLKHVYGPTETTVFATCTQLTLDNYIETPIGKPINNNCAYLLNAKKQLVPFGCIGELYLASDGISTGYLNQPELTAASFINNPFSHETSHKLYKTGDLARYLPCGNLVFSGRIDSQVKIRGFRIELGEIENALSLCQSIVACFVTVDLNKRIIAYVVTKDKLLDKSKHFIFIKALREQLQQKLPTYMMPAAFVILKNLPLTINNKIDHKALPQPDERLLQGEYIAPQTLTEKTLVAICRKLLKLGDQKLSIESNFFDIGGHSLLAVRLIAEIRNSFNQELAIKSIFDSNNLQDVAFLIDQGSNIDLRINITPIPATEPVQASFAQQRLWFIDQLQGNSEEYNIFSALKLDGKFTLPAATQALSAIVERHQSLRTVFYNLEGEVIQSILEQFDFQVIKYDLSAFKGAVQQAHIKELLFQNKYHRFNLAQDLMLRVSYLQLEPESGIVLFNMHHIAADGWSIGVLLQEFISLYKTIINDQPTSLPALKVQYRDYAHCQRQWLTGKVLQQQLNYWHNQLADLPSLHNIKLDYPRPAQKSHRGALIKQHIDKATSLQLLHIATEQQLTPFMLLHSALALLLSSHSNQQDIVIGTPVANRMQRELEPLIGFFVNTLVLRTNTFHTNLSQLFSHVRQINLEAQAHQETPFEQLVEQSNVVRSKQHTPLFQIMLMMDTNEQTELSLAGVKFTPWQTEEVVAKYDIEINAKIAEQGIEFTWVYDCTIFKSEHITALGEQLNRLLVAIVKNPTAALHDLCLLSETQKNYQLYQLNQTQTSYPAEQSLVEQFEAQAIKTPTLPAVIYAEQQLNYNQLNSRVNQLSHYLTQHYQLQADDMIGLCMTRQLDMVVALLAIIKTGAAYVPIDPKYPQARIDYLIKDAALTVIISQSSLTATLGFSNCPTITLDRLSLNDYSLANLPQITHKPTDLAYVIYTSGSTGQPKGVMLEHQSVSNYLSHARKHYLKDDIAASIVSSSLSFDATVTTILSPLLMGKFVELLEDNDQLMPQLFQKLTQSTEPLLFKITPAHLLALSHHETDKLTNMRHCIVIGGEQLTVNALKNWRKQLTKAVFINEYGPTEATVGCATFVIDKETKLSDTQAVPIGTAMQNTQLIILNDQLQLVPQGVVGQLYIAGCGLARGYHNQPILNQQRFIKNPYFDPKNKNSPIRLYQSGDLVQLDNQGKLHFIGRTDNQVKVRGFRIELGEIEQRIEECENIESATVIVKSERLIAYAQYLSKGDKIESIAEEENYQSIKIHLANVLPEYMQPDSIIMIEQWPLTSNGKIDRKALSLTATELKQDLYVEPSTVSEKVLTDLWQKLLNTATEHDKKIGVNDNFFNLGGHSLLIIQVIANVKNLFNVELATDFLFERSTIKALAEAIDQAQDKGLAKVSLQSKQLDLHKQVVLPLQFNKISTAEVGMVKTVFLTGATGFLGAFLLKELLTQTSVSVACLIRAHNKVEGFERIKQTLKKYQLWREDFHQRIHIYPGDLSSIRLGLTAQDWDELSHQVDEIYHNGAQVNFLYNYHALKKANVDSTLNIMALAINHKVKRIHYVSTLSIFSTLDYANNSCSETTTPSGKGLDGGYAQSKWVAEQLLLQAKDQGLPVSIYRPGRITGDSINGIANTDDFFYQMLRGCYQLNIKSYPQNIYLDMTPVDFVSQSIVHLAQLPKQQGQINKHIYHLFNPKPNDQVLYDTIVDRGHAMVPTSFAIWQQEVKKLLVKLPEDRLAAFNVILKMKPEDLDKGNKSDLPYDCKLTLKALESSDIECPAINSRLCNLYLDYLASIDFVPVRQTEVSEEYI